MNETILLRAHHALCMRFFIGKGYSAEFVAEMTSLKSRLDASPELTVRLIPSPDRLCLSCPHFVSGKCDSQEKVERYDRALLAAVGEEALPWREICAKVKTEILPNMRNVCSDCAWADICMEGAKAQLV